MFVRCVLQGAPLFCTRNPLFQNGRGGGDSGKPKRLLKNPKRRLENLKRRFGFLKPYGAAATWFCEKPF
jgi:hypothetical protein